MGRSLGAGIALLVVIMGAPETPKAQTIESTNHYTIVDLNIDGNPDDIAVDSRGGQLGHWGYVCNCNTMPRADQTTWRDVTFIDFDISGLTEPVPYVWLSFTSVIGTPSGYDSGPSGAQNQPIRVHSFESDILPNINDFYQPLTFIEEIRNPRENGNFRIGLDVTAAVNVRDRNI